MRIHRFDLAVSYSQEEVAMFGCLLVGISWCLLGSKDNSHC